MSAFTPGHRRDFTERPDQSQDDSWRHQHLEGEPEDTWRSRCERNIGDEEGPVARPAGRGISKSGGNDVPQTGEPDAWKGCKKPTTANEEEDESDKDESEEESEEDDHEEDKSEEEKSEEDESEESEEEKEYSEENDNGEESEEEDSEEDESEEEESEEGETEEDDTEEESEEEESEEVESKEDDPEETRSRRTVVLRRM